MPIREVAAAGSVGVPVAVLVAWLLGQVGVTMPPEVQSALGALIAALAGWLAHRP